MVADRQRRLPVRSRPTRLGASPWVQGSNMGSSPERSTGARPRVKGIVHRSPFVPGTTESPRGRSTGGFIRRHGAVPLNWVKAVPMSRWVDRAGRNPDAYPDAKGQGAVSRPHPRRPTIYDVAAEAGVSLATVSRTVNASAPVA